MFPTPLSICTGPPCYTSQTTDVFQSDSDLDAIEANAPIFLISGLGGQSIRVLETSVQPIKSCRRCSIDRLAPRMVLCQWPTHNRALLDSKCQLFHHNSRLSQFLAAHNPEFHKKSVSYWVNWKITRLGNRSTSRNPTASALPQQSECFLVWCPDEWYFSCAGTWDSRQSALYNMLFIIMKNVSDLLDILTFDLRTLNKQPVPS